MIDTPQALRAKMLYYLERGKNQIRRHGAFRETAFVYAADGLTEWDLNIEDRQQKRAKLENVVLVERPYLIIQLGDAWIAPSFPASQDPMRQEALFCAATHQRLGQVVAYVVYTRRDQRPREFHGVNWMSSDDPDFSAKSFLLRDIWSLLEKPGV